MANASTLLFPEDQATDRRSEANLTFVSRRNRLLRPSPVSPGVYGLDITGGCDHGCPFCHIQGSARYPGTGRLLFDPKIVDRLADALDELELKPTRVVLSPSSDPFPRQRSVREAAEAVIALLLEREIPVVV